MQLPKIHSPCFARLWNHQQAKPQASLRSTCGYASLALLRKALESSAGKAAGFASLNLRLPFTRLASQGSGIISRQSRRLR
ncbi:MAG: hypothetical protein MJ106_05710, partial [Lentisphaeria bacterium]|nr:hypothetical protein [Lentisphaeria bacterium]